MSAGAEAEHVDSIDRVTGVRALPQRLALLTAFVAALVLLLPLLPGAAPPARAAEANAGDPLRVTLTNISPSSIPRQGPLRITGTVHNPTNQVWNDIRIYPVLSGNPIGDTDALAEAAVSDAATTASGSRLTGEGQFRVVRRLAPGASAGFTLSVPRRDLPISGAPGVYWIGAQALGTGPDGRDILADGRARSFISLVPPRATAEVSLLVPLRQDAERDTRTRLTRPERLARVFERDGRLSRIVDLFGSTSEVTWLVDPALFDVASDLVANNRPLTLGPARSAEAEEEPPPSPSPANGAPAPALDEQSRDEIEDWLGRTTAALAGSPVLALPYADADALALMRHAPSLLERAHTFGEQRLEAHGVNATPAIAPPRGRVGLGVLREANRGITVVAGARRTDRTDLPTVTRDRAGHRILVPQQRITYGGPGPRQHDSALNLRQRILAEAALRAITGEDEPLLVQLPQQWNPGGYWDRSEFVEGLEESFLDIVGLPPATGEVESLTYTETDRAREIDAPLVRTSAGLLDAASLLANLLATENNVSQRLSAMAFRGSSYSSRGDQQAPASLLSTMVDTVHGLTSQVRVAGTEFVTLSGGSGTVTVSLINELPQPVRIGLDVRTSGSGDLSFTEMDPVTLQPEQRTAVRLEVSSSSIGVNEVTITPVTVDAEAIGTPLEMTIRSSDVGRWFWVLMASVLAVLLVMIIKRIRDRVVHRRWRREEQQ